LNLAHGLLRFLIGVPSAHAAFLHLSLFLFCGCADWREILSLNQQLGWPTEAAADS
jgi:hypothetical protein